jgi:hypothetical protein
LPGGTLLVIGGLGSDGQGIASMESYDPDTRRFSPVGELAEGRFGHTATTLAAGQVLVVGGYGGSTDEPRLQAIAELYDPDQGEAQVAATMQAPRWWHSATLLDDGQVLVLGGIGEAEGKIPPTELYDPAAGRFVIGERMAKPRSRHTATLLDDGRVLVVGGMGRNGAALRMAELYDPVTGAFTSSSDKATPRTGHTATRLDDGRVLIVGGRGDMGRQAEDASLRSQRHAAR